MTATAHAGAAAAVPARPAPPRAGQSADNYVEELVVGSIIDDVVESITDRSGGDHPHPWTPEARVRVGVLRFTVTPPPPPDDSGRGDGDDSDDTSAASPKPAHPINNPGVIGFDFVVASTTEVTLRCVVDYSLYHQLWPTFEAVHAQAAANLTAAGAAATQAAVTAVTGADDDTDDTDTGDGDGDGDGVSGPLPATPSVPGAAKRRRRRPTVKIFPTWRRDDRHITFDITVPVHATDETTVSSRSLLGGDPLLRDAAVAVQDHYHSPDAARKLAGPQTLPAGDITEQPTYRSLLSAKTDSAWQPIWPEPELTVFAVRAADGDVAVSVSLVNTTDVDQRPFQDLSLYDCKLGVTVAGGATLRPQRLGFAHDDPRFSDVATVVGRGRGCVARGDVSGEMRVFSDTLPIFSQPATVQNPIDGADVRFATLTANPMVTLDAVASGMRRFLRAWPAPSGTDEGFFTDLRDQFETETERFELGCDLLRRDAKLLRSFRLANRAFARANPEPNAQWRLFQVVYIVSQLPALAVRTNPTDAQLRAELDAVDVLWFPTGGGKTEAYLGLIATALFYDRMRGKHRGTTAWLLFPLRMLSVQQLARMERVLYHAEWVRCDEGVDGDEFTLGYLVGSGNTPNRLVNSEKNGWWPGLRTFAGRGEPERDRRRLVGECPACRDGNSVGLDADLTTQRVLHVCRRCGHHLAIHISDEEVFRFSSSVVVSTVDKTASFSRNGEFTSFNHGPRYQCPQHGYFAFKNCPGENCTATTTTPPPFVDPTPALWIQDELHLVREELGVFASHYHTLVAELAIGAGNLPSKVLAATATIEQYEDQLRQVYGRKPRMFPTGGPTRTSSFYTTTTDDTRRIYLGVLPSGGGTAKVDLAGELLGLLVKRVHELTDDPTPLLHRFTAAGHTLDEAAARDVLFRYEVALGYVNSKAHGVNILDDISRISDGYISLGSDAIDSTFLNSDTPLGELARIVAAITSATPAVPRAKRNRCLVGTSVVSHGVDLARLNLEVVAGMPPSYADYIQASSRAGRAHVGLIIVTFDRLNRRETSIYHSFLTAHAALDRMVEPVPVNRFATRAVERTLPGVVCTLLWDEAYRDPSAPERGIGLTRWFKPWWNTVAATLGPQLLQRIRRAYTSPVTGVNPPAAERLLADAAVERWEIERGRMQQFNEDYLTDLFSVRAMTSLRDVATPVEFSGLPRAEQIVERLNGAPPPPTPAAVAGPARASARTARRSR